MHSLCAVLLFSKPGNLPDVFVYLFVISDVDECASNPCLNDGTCVDRLDGFTCQCTDGFTGTLCNNGWLM